MFELTSFSPSVQVNCVFNCLRNRHLGGELGAGGDALSIGRCSSEAEMLPGRYEASAL